MNLLSGQVIGEIEEFLKDGGARETPVTEAAKLSEDLGFDSLDLVELAMDLEERFGVRISDSEIEAARTVGDLVTAVRNAE
jgi:acyl carrier protein